MLQASSLLVHESIVDAKTFMTTSTRHKVVLSVSICQTSSANLNKVRTDLVQLREKLVL